MADNVKDNEEAKRPQSPKSAQEVATEDVEAAMQRLRIRPRKVLESLGHLRIKKTRIKPLEGKTSSGGYGDVAPAILVPEEFPILPESDDGEYVAVKKLHPDTNNNHGQVIAPFAHEVSLLNDLANENVVKIIGFVEEPEEGIAWMVFSWEKNGNLREFVTSADWELPERVSLIHDVARGISYLHGRTPPICHGDLKSLNILVNSENRAIISDLGSARAVDSLPKDAVREVNGAAAPRPQDQFTTGASTMEPLKAEVSASGNLISITGPGWTVRWAAPELLEREFPGLASDIWAFGWICWEAVTGKSPFEEAEDIRVVSLIKTGKLPAIGDDNQLKQIKALGSLMGECWRFDENKRPKASRCEQVISFMDKTVPSTSEKDGLAKTRSSRLLYALGHIQLRNSNRPEARKYFQESFDVAKSVGDEKDKARALIALGDAYRQQNETVKAEDSYTQARDIFSQIGDQQQFAHSVNYLGDVYLMRSEYSKAEDSYTQARDIYSQIGDRLGFAHSVKGLGDVHCVRDEYSKAEDSFIQARDIFSQIGNQSGVAYSAKGLGNVYQFRDEYSKAEESYIQAREIFSQVGNEFGFAESVEGLGDVYRLRGELSKAVDSYDQARQSYFRAKNPVGVAQTVQALGGIWVVLKEYSKAEEWYILARNMFSRVGSQLSLAHSIQSLGDVYRLRSEYSKAEDSYIQSRDIYSQIGNSLGSANSVYRLGHLYLAQEEYGKAEESYLNAQAVFRQLGNKLDLAGCLRCIGSIRHIQAQYVEAERFVEEASTIFGELGFRDNVVECDNFLQEVRQRMTTQSDLPTIYYLGTYFSQWLLHSFHSTVSFVFGGWIEYLNVWRAR